MCHQITLSFPEAYVAEYFKHMMSKERPDLFWSFHTFKNLPSLLCKYEKRMMSKKEARFMTAKVWSFIRIPLKKSFILWSQLSRQNFRNRRICLRRIFNFWNLEMKMAKAFAEWRRNVMLSIREKWGRIQGLARSDQEKKARHSELKKEIIEQKKEIEDLLKEKARLEEKVKQLDNSNQQLRKNAKR